MTLLSDSQKSGIVSPRVKIPSWHAQPHKNLCPLAQRGSPGSHTWYNPWDAPARSTFENICLTVLEGM